MNTHYRTAPLQSRGILRSALLCFNSPATQRAERLSVWRKFVNRNTPRLITACA